MTRAPIPIGIAVVEHAGRYLVGIRGDDVPLAGYAEFPGGKCGPGEPTNACARRECLEETGLAVVPIKLLDQRRLDYDHGPVELTFWLCRVANAVDVAESHNGYRWAPAEELRDLHFPPANEPLIEQLVSGRSL